MHRAMKVSKSLLLPVFLACAVLQGNLAFAGSRSHVEMPGPVPAALLTIDPKDSSKVDHTIQYKDCVEISLFRLVLAFAKVDSEKVLLSAEMAQFATDNEFDWSVDPASSEKWPDLRASWADWLAGREGFVYASAGKLAKPNTNTHELKATWENVRQFFISFFPKIGLNKDATPDKIADICQYFGYEFACKVEPLTKHGPFMRENEKGENETINREILTININYVSEPYLKWEIHQIFRIDPRQRITGDSDLMDVRSGPSSK